MIYLPDRNVNDDERAMRREMLYFFNPALKYIFYSRNPQGFAQYGFNSCRQTAVFAAGYMQEMFPEYGYTVCEGKFHDKLNGKDVDYVHAFVLAKKLGGTPRGIGIPRTILIDLSRTTRPLKFQIVRDWNNIYEKGMYYEDCCLESYTSLDLNSMLNMPDVEFLSQLPPQTTMTVLKMLIKQLHELSIDDQVNFYRSVYGSLTTLLEREVSTQ